jgi:hypothetical protein
MLLASKPPTATYSDRHMIKLAHLAVARPVQLALGLERIALPGSHAAPQLRLVHALRVVLVLQTRHNRQTSSEVMHWLITSVRDCARAVGGTCPVPTKAEHAAQQLYMCL